MYNDLNSIIPQLSYQLDELLGEQNNHTEKEKTLIWNKNGVTEILKWHWKTNLKYKQDVKKVNIGEHLLNRDTSE